MRTDTVRSTRPHGESLYHDIRRLLPGYRAEVIFDVGANEGQSTRGHFVHWFPGVHVYCFEPVASTYGILRSAMSGLPNVRCVQMALGSEAGVGHMLLQGASDQFTLASKAAMPASSMSDRMETVPISTIDAFCTERGISHLGLLKIDTEGGDLDVLKGAREMIRLHAIDLIQVEAGMNPTNTQHVPFQAFLDYLASDGYRLFGVYHQFHERFDGSPVLRRCDPVFISPSLAAHYTHHPDSDS